MVVEEAIGIVFVVDSLVVLVGSSTETRERLDRRCRSTSIVVGRESVGENAEKEEEKLSFVGVVGTEMVEKALELLVGVEGMEVEPEASKSGRGESLQISEHSIELQETYTGDLPSFTF